MGDEAGQQPVAGAMAEAVGRLLAIDADGHDHVEPVVDQLVDHRRRARRVVGGVAVDQHVDVGLDVGEHAPHHVALALVGLAADHGAGLLRRLDGAVGRIVVVDVDRGVRQRGAEIGHDLGDRALLVVARHQHRDLVPALGHALPNDRCGTCMKRS